jgi:hypothetical protein
MDLKRTEQQNVDWIQVAQDRDQRRTAAGNLHHSGTTRCRTMKIKRGNVQRNFQTWQRTMKTKPIHTENDK